MFWFAVPFVSKEITSVEEQSIPEQYGNELETPQRNVVLNNQHRPVDPVTSIKHGAMSSVAPSILLIDDSLPYLELLALEFKFKGIQKVS